MEDVNLGSWYGVDVSIPTHTVWRDDLLGREAVEGCRVGVAASRQLRQVHRVLVLLSKVNIEAANP